VNERVLGRVVAGGIVLTVVAVVIQSAAHIFNVWALDNYWDALNADSDTGGGAWASSGLEFASACFVLLLAACATAWEWPLVSLAGILAFFSLDDVIQVHERVSRLALDLHLWAHAGRLVWPIIFLPLLVASFGGLWFVAHEAGGAAWRLIVIGLGLLVLAVGLEIAAQGLFVLDVGRLDAPFVAEVVVEEGAELMGWGLIATGLAAAAAQALAGDVEASQTVSSKAPVAPPP
jgi:hypothetical protein